MDPLPPTDQFAAGCDTIGLSLEPVEIERKTRLIGNGRHVQGHVGGTANRRIDPDRVFYTTLVNDMAGGYPLFHQGDDLPPGFLGCP